MCGRRPTPKFNAEPEQHVSPVLVVPLYRRTDLSRTVRIGGEIVPVQLPRLSVQSLKFFRRRWF